MIIITFYIKKINNKTRIILNRKNKLEKLFFSNEKKTRKA